MKQNQDFITQKETEHLSCSEDTDLEEGEAKQYILTYYMSNEIH